MRQTRSRKKTTAKKVSQLTPIVIIIFVILAFSFIAWYMHSQLAGQVGNSDQVVISNNNPLPTQNSKGSMLPPPSIDSVENTKIGNVNPAVENDSLASEINDGPYDIVSGSFDVPSSVYRNSSVTCHYLIPHTKVGIIPSPERHIVCYFPFPKEEQFFNDVTFIRLCKESGLIVFGVYFAHQAEGELDNGDRSKCYYYPESGSGDVIFKAQKEVCILAKIPLTKMIAFGNSGGACAAAFFSNSFPDCFDAVIETGCGAYPHTIQSHAKAWLLLHSTGDSVESENKNAFKELSQTCSNVFYITTPPEWGRRGRADNYFSHCINDDAREIVFSFIDSFALTAKPESLQQPSDPKIKIPFKVSFIDACRKAPPPRRIIDYSSGHRYILAQPRTDRPAIGVILFDAASYDAGEKEMLYDMDYLSSEGYIVATVNLSNEADCKNRLDSIFQTTSQAITKVFLVGFDPAPENVSTLRNDQRVKGRIFFETYSIGLPLLNERIQSMINNHENIHLYIRDGSAPWGIPVSNVLEEMAQGSETTARYCQIRLERILPLLTRWGM